MSDKQAAVAIVGYGSAGRQHTAAIEGLDQVVLAAVFEPDDTVETPAVRRLQSWRDVLADNQIDIVALCTPPGTHADLAVAALRAGKAVLVEKPPAATVEELALMTEAAELADRPIGVMLQHRFLLAPDLDRTLVSGPACTGALVVSRQRPPAHYERVPWRRDPVTAVGGITAHLGVHYLDLACQILGPLHEIDLTATRNIAVGIDSCVTGTVTFVSGATLAVTITGESPLRTERLQILGERGGLTIEDGHVSEWTLESTRTWPSVPAAQLRRQVYQEIARAVISGEPLTRCRLDSAEAVTAILDTVARRQRSAVR
ncbi:Gfo/Idh/MocA family protein [Nocardia sp. NPDC004722]